ncbi:MAG TPA: DUF1476 domain-containing protein [Stellaceae bacterium]|nr:DUF1476 domain-containing protein [Stellaceae bacterium]
MSIFRDREQAAEHEFEHDQELAFKIAARRNKLLSQWAANHMGLSGEAAQRYARELVETHVADHDETSIVGSVIADLIAHGMPIPEEDIRSRLAEFARKARADVLRDGKAPSKAI